MTLQEIHLAISKIISELATIRRSNVFLGIAYSRGEARAEEVAETADNALLQLRCLRLSVERVTGQNLYQEPND